MILITGSTGFIGSNFVASLNGRGRTDLVLCDTLEGADRWRNIGKAVFHDFIPPSHLFDWLLRNPVEAIIHMGAISSTTASDGDEVIDVNFRLPLALLDHCTTAQISLLYASSAAVYGDGSLGFQDELSPEHIRSLRPLNLYGWSKRQFDFVVADRLASGQPMPPTCIGLRFFNVFGPNEYHKGDMMSIVAKISAPIARGERISLFKSHRGDVADGDQRRDFIYVTDAVNASLALLEKGGTGIYNIGTGQARSFRELAEAVFAATEKPIAIDYVEMPEAIRARYQYFTQAPIDRLRGSGFHDQFAALEQNVADYVENYLLQNDLYR